MGIHCPGVYFRCFIPNSFRVVQVWPLAALQGKVCIRRRLDIFEAFTIEERTCCITFSGVVKCSGIFSQPVYQVELRRDKVSKKVRCLMIGEILIWFLAKLREA